MAADFVKGCGAVGNTFQVSSTGRSHTKDLLGIKIKPEPALVRRGSGQGIIALSTLSMANPRHGNSVLCAAMSVSRRQRPRQHLLYYSQPSSQKAATVSTPTSKSKDPLLSGLTEFDALAPCVLFNFGDVKAIDDVTFGRLIFRVGGHCHPMYESEQVLQHNDKCFSRWHL
jgi:hypothetical protein